MRLRKKTTQMPTTFGYTIEFWVISINCLYDPPWIVNEPNIGRQSPRADPKGVEIEFFL